MLPMPYDRTDRGAPLSMIAEVHRELDRVFDRMLGDASTPGRPASAIGTWAPAVDVQETEGELRFTVEAPGLGPDDLQVDVTGEVLTISGEKRVERDETQGPFRLMERRVGRFSRSFTLPAHTDPDHASAEYENGVLTVSIPRRAGTRTRRIDVKSSFFQKLLGGRRKHEHDHGTA